MQKTVINPSTGNLDVIQDLSETIGISDLSDVTITGGVQYDLLQLNAANEWVNVSDLTMASGASILADGGTLTLGQAGDTTMGDGTERDFYPQTSAKINLGKSANKFNDGYFAGDVSVDGVLSGLVSGGMYRKKLLPCDCVGVHSYANLRPTAVGTEQKSYMNYSPYDFVWYVEIPYGMTATAVMVYGEDTASTVAVYSCEIDDGTTLTSLGSGTIGTEVNITDEAYSTTNYLAITVNQGSTTTDEIFGGYVDFSIT